MINKEIFCLCGMVDVAMGMKVGMFACPISIGSCWLFIHDIREIIDISNGSALVVLTRISSRSSVDCSVVWLCKYMILSILIVSTFGPSFIVKE